MAGLSTPPAAALARPVLPRRISQREIEIMQMVDHPHVIKLYEIFDEPKKMQLVMELVTGGELFDKIVALGSYTEKVTHAAGLRGIWRAGFPPRARRRGA